MSEKTSLQCSQFPRRYGATGHSDPCGLAEGPVTYECPNIQTEEGHHGSANAATVPGVLSNLPTSGVQRDDNQHPEPPNTHESRGPIQQATETEPESDELVTSTNTSRMRHHPRAARNNESRITRWQQYWQHFTFAAAEALIIVVILVVTFTLWKTSSSNSTQVFAGDVVLISSINRFWYDQMKIRQQPPEGTEQAEATIYIDNCASKERLNKSNFSSRTLLYTAPQGLYNLQQQYLLAGSDLVINVTTHVSYDSDTSAKVCQYSKVNDYDELLKAETKAAVDEAEKNGFCQPIEPPSGSTPHTTMIQFNIDSHGYYYYALAVVPGKQMNISYTYVLIKHYYDKNELTPYNCSVVDQECVLHGLLEITADNCVLTFIPTPAAIEPLLPYTFYTEQTCAWGISILFFCVAVIVACCVFLSTSLCCAYYETKCVNGVV